MAANGSGSGHAARKSLGQHFLTNRKAVARIVDAVPMQASVLEIGPGRGALTIPLLSRAAHLTVIEKDDRLAAMWHEKASSCDTLECVHGDVLEVLADVLERSPPDWVVGNLPYNISGPLSARLFAYALDGMVLMYQREVASRILATPGSKTYGSLSVLARHHYEIRRLLTLPPGAFNPPPKVHSVVLVFRPHGCPRRCSYAALEKAVRQGFAHRRKTVANNFRGRITAGIWRRLGIDPGSRPEQLDYPGWETLARFLETGSGFLHRHG